MAAKTELKKKTSLGEKRSGIEKKAKIKVPSIKPNCTTEVMLANIPGRLSSRLISGATTFPANQSEVPRN